MADLNDIVVFARVAQFESFRRAAHAIGMPVSRVSRKVSELEAQILSVRRSTGRAGRLMTLWAPRSKKCGMRVALSGRRRFDSVQMADSDSLLGDLKKHRGCSPRAGNAASTAFVSVF